MTIVMNGSNSQFPWPTFKEFLALKQTRLSNLGRMVKVLISMAHARLHGRKLDNLAEGIPQAAQLFRQCPLLSKAILDNYVDARLGAAARIRMIEQELRVMMDRLIQSGIGEFSAADVLSIWCSDGGELKVDFQVNTTAPQEGLWMLCLRDQAGALVYKLSFACASDYLLVGAVQGPRGEDALDLVRQATKVLHGVRPPFFLMDVLRALAQAWGAHKLVGVGSKYQISAPGLVKKKEGLKFDYSKFWQEVGGTLNARHGWDIPLTSSRKSLEEVESKKRATYRRRFALLDSLTMAVGAVFAQSASVGQVADMLNN